MKAKQVKNMPQYTLDMIDAYLKALKERDKWKFNAGFHFIRDDNINNVSSSRKIEQTGFTKNDDMMPEKARGVGYQLGVSKDTNVQNHHYVTFSNQLSGENYWTNHKLDDISNTTILGYRYKAPSFTVSVLPFHLRRYVANHRYSFSNGLRLHFNNSLNEQWSLSLNGEIKSNHHLKDFDLNGYSLSLSANTFWARKATQSFNLGVSTFISRTDIKRQNSDTFSFNIGYNQEWFKGVSTALSFNYAYKKFKDKAKLGDILPLNKIRQDNIFTINMQLWKKDWNLWGITPKLEFHWKKQMSNIPTMYSFSKHNFNVVLEKDF